MNPPSPASTSGKTNWKENPAFSTMVDLLDLKQKRFSQGMCICHFLMDFPLRKTQGTSFIDELCIMFHLVKVRSDVVKRLSEGNQRHSLIYCNTKNLSFEELV